MSAATTPTSVTLGKSSPLAIIWVPTSTLVSPRRKASSIFWCASLPWVVSMSMRPTRASGNSRATSSCTFWVPAPKYLMYTLPQLGQVLGGGMVLPQ